MEILRNVNEVLEKGINLISADRVLVCIPPEKDWKQNFQELADTALDVLENTGSIVYNQGIKNVIIKTEVLKTNLAGVSEGDTIYIKPNSSKHFATIAEGELHLVYKEDIFFIAPKK